MSQYPPESTKTGDFNPQRTLSGSFFVIPECLTSIRFVVLSFTAKKQTLSIIYIDYPFAMATGILIVDYFRIYLRFVD